MSFDPAALAAHLLAARRARRIVPTPPQELLPRTHGEGVAAQRALADAMGCAAPAGFKIGATARTMQAYL